MIKNVEEIEMRLLSTVLTVIVTMVCLTACNSREEADFTSFFKSHDFTAYVKSVCKEKGCNVKMVKSGKNHGEGRSGGKIVSKKEGKSIQVFVKLDHPTIENLMRVYQDFIESELKKAGTNIIGVGISSGITTTSFELKYHKSRVTGSVKIEANAKDDGYTVEFNIEEQLLL
jgi:hypothetical protein